MGDLTTGEDVVFGRRTGGDSSEKEGGVICAVFGRFDIGLLFILIN